MAAFMKDLNKLMKPAWSLRVICMIHGTGADSLLPTPEVVLDLGLQEHLESLTKPREPSLQ